MIRMPSFTIGPEPDAYKHFIDNLASLTRVDVVRFNELLELIQYNVTVKSNLYAKYYFELRALFKDNEKEFPMKPLDKKDAENLELRSKDYKDQF